MPIKRWASGFTSTVYKALYGNHLLKQIYYGRQLVFDTGSDFNYFDITPGTKTITIPTRAVYNIQLVGGGGGGRADAFPYGGYWWSSAGSGGSGAYVYGWKELDAGTYTVTVGAGGKGAMNGASYDGTASTGFGETAGGGIKGVAGAGGAGGTATVDVLYGVNGYQGATGNLNVGGVSTGRTKTPYDGSLDGIGSGGASSANGGNGLVAVSYLSPPLSPMFSSSTPGTYTITIPITAIYEVILVGGGGGAARTWYYDRAYNIARAGGGSGAYVYGKLKIEAGTYTVVVGAGGTAGGDAHASRLQGGTGGSSTFLGQTAAGGTGGLVWFENTVSGTQATAGTGGTATVSSPWTATNGNSGTARNNSWGVEPSIQGGASVYNGYGAGTADASASGGNGFVSIRQLSGTAPTTFTVNTSPSDATVTFSSVPIDGILARNGNTVTAYPGTQITYTITRSGYTTYTETITLLSQTTKNITMVPRRTITVTSTSNPISSAKYKINNGDWQTLTLTNNIGTITCDDGDDLLVSAQGGNYNEEDEAKQGTVYSKRIRTIAGDDSLTFNFAYEAWDEVKYCACRSAAGIGSNLAFIALDESYISYSTASNFKYLDIVYDNITIEGETFNNVPSYRFLVKHGTSFTFGLEIPDHRYSVESANATIQYTPGEAYYVGPTWTSFFAVDVVTIALTDDTAVVSDLSTPIYTRQENSIRVMRGQTLQYTLYKNGHTHTESYVNYELLPAPTTETITIDPTTFLGYTITFNINVSGATIVVDSTTLSGNSTYIYKDDTSNHPYTITKAGYNTVTGTITYPTDYYTHTIDITMQDLYPSGTVVFQSGTAGTTTWTVPVTKTYEITAVGGGGGTVVAVGGGSTKARACTGAAGGSGGRATGRFALTEGQTLTIVIGVHGDDKTDQLYTGSGTNYITCPNGGNSSVTLDGKTLVNATGGGGGYTDNRTNNNYYASPRAGGGGSGSVDSSAISSSTANGNAGTAQHKGWDYSISVTGGASVFGGYGKASSGSAWCPAGVSIDGTGTAGGVKITAV